MSSIDEIVRKIEAEFPNAAWSISRITNPHHTASPEGPGYSVQIVHPGLPSVWEKGTTLHEAHARAAARMSRMVSEQLGLPKAPVVEPSSVVMFDGNGLALYLTSVKWKDGRPVSGYVQNGGWKWSRRDGKEFAKACGGFVVNSWPERQYTVVPVERDGDYNAVIEAARAKAAKG